MIYTANAQPLLEEHRVALDNEASATKKLEALWQSGIAEESSLEAQMKQMIDAHNRSMEIWDQLQQFRVTAD